ncbi:hypothetical protein [Steroidobacter agaridevorans]|uniref:hypothetical protein n=1 Tax=Steroidobacter agaridevorans TaxID=2695856 RepID=UPI00132BDCF0|nr:hypothetical protein [Steroidobacter agaridevorans]GFE88023.1 hypothetical protein GCM10011488_29770 [Steroidobacter agaridevorans]
MITYNVFLDRTRLPAAADWARTIREAGFEVQLNAEFEPGSFSGYLPCPDDRTGFEYYLESFTTPTLEIGDAGAQAIGSRNAVASLRFSGRSSDRDAASAAAATLAAMTDGVLFDTEPGHFIAADEALAWARNERYQPIATYHRRAMRRKARLTPPIILRLLIILFLVLAIYWLRK